MGYAWGIKMKTGTGYDKKRKEIPIGLFFLKYFLYIFAGILLTAAFCGCAVLGLFAADLVYPARHVENQVQAAAESIQKADRVTKELIPELCQYVLLDQEGRILDGDMSEKEVEHAKNVIRGKELNGGNFFGADFYAGIPRDGEYCIVRYQIAVQYKSALLRKYLPLPETLIIIVFFALVLVIILTTAVRFNSVIRQKLAPLADTADRIQGQELEFEIAYGSVKEINAVLKAMDDMREALKESLESQWQLEQMKKEQMSALAHDLKTPLTLVRGNAELLQDTELTEEQEEYAGCIADSAGRMQNYVQMMLEMTKAAAAVPVIRRMTDSDALLDEVKRQAGSLCSMHQVTLQWECRKHVGDIWVEEELLLRAFINVAANAAEHTPSGGRVSIEVDRTGDEITYTVTDTGPGFSKEALRHGKEQFYMEDTSRTADAAHYGMGLYIVDRIVRQHGGLVCLENVCMPERGAKVIIKIPVSASAAAPAGKEREG